MLTFALAFEALTQAELAQLVEHWLPKPRVAGSSPVFRSHFYSYFNTHIF